MKQDDHPKSPKEQLELAEFIQNFIGMVGVMTLLLMIFDISRSDVGLSFFVYAAGVVFLAKRSAEYDEKIKEIKEKI